MTYQPTDEQIEALGKLRPGGGVEALVDGPAFHSIIRSAQAHALRAAAEEWAADPDSWGDHDRDYRNTLRERATDLDGKTSNEEHTA